MKVRKKPVVVEAVQWNGDNTNEIISFCGSCCVQRQTYLVIKTLEGNHIADIGDFIIKGVNGEFYPCKPDIFKQTYDIVNDDECVSLKHYENLKQWVDEQLVCEYDDPVWNPKVYEAIHYILDDYKLRINCQLTAKETVNDEHL